jgi:two-component system sensor histidine kinase YesM
VEDNGIGMTPEHLDTIRKLLGKSPNSERSNSVYGLYNVSKRLELYYNRTDLLEIKSVYKEGTTVTLRIPKSGIPEAYQNV